MAVISYIGIGSNMGRRKANIHKALEFLKRQNIKIKKISRIIETEPVDGPRQAKFLNAAVKTETDLSPQRLLDILKDIEKKMGRKKTIKNGPRPIDLDILLYADKIIKSKRLTVPHPRMLKRDFVMVPLLEVASSETKKFIRCN